MYYFAHDCNWSGNIFAISYSEPALAASAIYGLPNSLHTLLYYALDLLGKEAGLPANPIQMAPYLIPSIYCHRRQPAASTTTVKPAFSKSKDT